MINSRKTQKRRRSCGRAAACGRGNQLLSDRLFVSGHEGQTAASINHRVTSVQSYIFIAPPHPSHGCCKSKQGDAVLFVFNSNSLQDALEQRSVPS